jgi:PAS domain S-box-containing protein
MYRPNVNSVAPTDSVEQPAGRRADASDLQSQVDLLAAENLRLQAELELRDRALNATASGFLIIDIQQRHRPIVFANRALGRQTGYSISELVGVPAEILNVRDADLDSLKEVRDAMRAGREHRAELRCRRKDGSEFWAGIFLGPVHDPSGNVTHYVNVGADITARMEAERKRQELQSELDEERHNREHVENELRLAQKLEAVGRLAAGVAHEINTPIQYVGDSVHFLQSACADMQTLIAAYRSGIADIAAGAAVVDIQRRTMAAEQAADIEFVAAEMPKAFERTLEGVERVTKIVRAMKEFSHPDVEEQNTADINHALESTLIVAKNEYKYSAEVETSFAELPPIMCNIGELNQVFLNLLINASHAIADGGKDAGTGKIFVSTELKGETVEIVFADNGCGIPKAHLDKIFDPFFTTKEVGRGTGQGLAITRSIIVDKHRGSVQVDSKTGVGTKFILQLPVAGRTRTETR